MARAAQRTILRRVSEGKLVIDKKGRAVTKKPEVVEVVVEEPKTLPQVQKEKISKKEVEVKVEEAKSAAKPAKIKVETKKAVQKTKSKDPAPAKKRYKKSESSTK